ncbi:MAG: transposase [Lewinellaceae bacterium]|nr:transposase [Lewinellaceae bacterium]
MVLVDQIYLNRGNRKYLKDRGIRYVGRPLGRSPEMSRQEKQKRKKEQNKRSEIEGKFGQGKSKYGLDDIQTRREDASYACIGLILLALNIIKLGREIFVSIFSLWCRLLKQVASGQGKFNSIWEVVGSIGPPNTRPALAVG